MGLIQNLIKKMKGDKSGFKEKLKQAQEDDRVYTMVEERKKSSNQRELERYDRENHEARIKRALEKIHHKQNQENWKGNSILKSQTSIMRNDRPILKEKNLFKGKGNMFNKAHAKKTKTDMGFWK